MYIGVDLVDVGRMQRTLSTTPGFVRRVFTDTEVALAGDLEESMSLEFLAGRFAAKEAVLKALGKGICDGVMLNHIETLRTPSGAPKLHLMSTAGAAVSALSLSTFQISISHDGGFAVAFVLLAP